VGVHAAMFEKSTWFYILTMSKIQSGTVWEV